jgi:hypothetical protein
MVVRFTRPDLDSEGAAALATLTVRRYLDLWRLLRLIRRLAKR